MCFSVEADLIAGTAVTAMGVAALRGAGSGPERVLASLSVVLGAHLLVEVPVWLSLENELPDWIGHGAIAVYLGVAFVIVPVLAPLAVGMAIDARRRWRVWPFVALGAAVATSLLVGLVQGPIGARVEGYHLSYEAPAPGGGWVTVLYVLATCGAALASGDRPFVLFGALNLVAVGILAAVEQGALISLWCAWAAVTSGMILLRIRRRPPVESTDRLRTAVSAPSGGGAP